MNHGESRFLFVCLDQQTDDEIEIKGRRMRGRRLDYSASTSYQRLAITYTGFHLVTYPALGLTPSLTDRSRTKSQSSSFPGDFLWVHLSPPLRLDLLSITLQANTQHLLTRHTLLRATSSFVLVTVGNHVVHQPLPRPAPSLPRL
jgi:hypothetical protein